MKELPEQKEIPASGVLDPQALESLLAVIGGEKAMLTELIDSFLHEAPKLFAAFHEALQQNDAAKLRMAAHTIKSSAGDFGALTLNTTTNAIQRPKIIV
jgi:HPt (histidine-containing phosphotransfer) domain-containing protein